MVQIIDEYRKPSFTDRLGRVASAGTGTYLEHLLGQREQATQEQQLQKENETFQKLTGQDVSGIRDPKIRQKITELTYQGKNNAAEIARKLTKNDAIISDLEQKRGLEPGSLSAYREDPAMAERISRPAKESKKTQASQPIDPDQLQRIQEVRSQPGFDELDEVDQYRALTNAGVSKENAESEAKLTGMKLERAQKSFESAYKTQENFINETTDKYRAFETEMKPRLLQMQKVLSDEQLISPTAAVFLENMGIPLGALEDPSSELYQKLSLDLLKGLPEIYGNRIMKVEVDNFLKTIPSLLNSSEGRRMIASNMIKLGEMKEVYYNEMRKQQQASLDTNKPLPRDFQQRVFDQVKPQIDRINNEFVKMSEIKSIPKNTVLFFNPMGEIEFVPKEDVQWAMENGGRRIW